MQKLILGILCVLVTQSTFAYTLEQAQEYKEQCRNPRNITFKYADTSSRASGSSDDFDILENNKVIGFHHCRRDGGPSTVFIDGASFTVFGKHCVAALKFYQEKYKTCLEVNSILEKAEKSVSTVELKTEGEASVLEINNLNLGEDYMSEIAVFSDGQEVAKAYCPTRGASSQIVINNQAYEIKDCDNLFKSVGKRLKVVLNQKDKSAQIVLNN